MWKEGTEGTEVDGCSAGKEVGRGGRGKKEAKCTCVSGQDRKGIKESWCDTVSFLRTSKTCKWAKEAMRVGGTRREQKDERATGGGAAAGDEDKQVSKRQTALVSISNGRQDVGECFLLCRAAENSPNFTPHVKKSLRRRRLKRCFFFHPI